MQKWISLVLICISYQTGELRQVFIYLLAIVFLLCDHLFLLLLYYEFFIQSLILFQCCLQFVLCILIGLWYQTYFKRNWPNLFIFSVIISPVTLCLDYTLNCDHVNISWSFLICSAPLFNNIYNTYILYIRLYILKDFVFSYIMLQKSHTDNCLFHLVTVL